MSAAATQRLWFAKLVEASARDAVARAALHKLAGAGNASARRALEAMAASTPTRRSREDEVRMRARLDAIESGERKARASRNTKYWFDTLVEEATASDADALSALRKMASAGNVRALEALQAMNEPTSELVASNPRKRRELGFRPLAERQPSKNEKSMSMTPSEARAARSRLTDGSRR